MFVHNLNRRVWRVCAVLTLAWVFIVPATPVHGLTDQLLISREDHTATVLADGSVLVVGGMNRQGMLAATELIDPTGSVTLAGATLSRPRAGHTASRLDDGTVLVVGGRSAEGQLDTTEIYDPATGGFESGPGLAVARANHSATLLDDGRLLVVGGDVEGTAEIFDPGTGEFALLEVRLERPRSRHGALRLEDGSVLLAGGLDPEGEPLDSAEVFVPTRLEFVPVRGWMHSTRERPVLRSLWDGKVQVIGGDADASMELFEPGQRYFRAQAVPALATTLLSSDEFRAIETAAEPGADAPLDLGRSPRRGTRTVYDLPGASAHGRAATVEMPELGLRAHIGGRDPGGNATSAIEWVTLSPATISTDRIDYGSTMAPVISGRHWQPGERVLVFRQPTPAVTGLVVLPVDVDPDGSFVCTDLTSADHRPLTTYLITAVGLESRRVAQTAYYDAPDRREAAEQVWSDPVRAEFTVPLTDGAGSTETPLGTLTWSAWENQGSEDSPRVSGLNFDLEEWFQVQFPSCGAEDGFAACWKLCIGKDGAAEQADADVEVCATIRDLLGYVEVSGSFDSRLDVDHGTADVLPELRGLVAGAHLSADVEFRPQIELEGYLYIDVPLWGVAREFEVRDAGVRGVITFGLVLHLEGGVSGLVIEPRLTAGAAVAPGLYYETTTWCLPPWGWPCITFPSDVGVKMCGENNDECRFNFDTGLEVVEFGDAYIKLALGPMAGLDMDFGIASAELEAFIGPYAKGTLGLEGVFGECAPWDIGLDVGIDGYLSAKDIEVFGVDFDPIPKFTFTLWDETLVELWGTGALRVMTTTVGYDLDHDGYSVAVRRAEPEVDPVWSEETTADLGLDDEITLEGETCRQFVGSDPEDCALAATYHAAEIRDVMWNCSALAWTHDDVCLSSSDVAEVEFEVKCRPIFGVMRETVAQMLREGEIHRPRVAHALDRLLSLAEAARGAPGSAPVPVSQSIGETFAIALEHGGGRPTCGEILSRFEAFVQRNSASGDIEASAAAVLSGRAGDIREHYCGLAADEVPARTTGARARDLSRPNGSAGRAALER